MRKLLIRVKKQRGTGLQSPDFPKEGTVFEVETVDLVSGRISIRLPGCGSSYILFADEYEEVCDGFKGTEGIERIERLESILCAIAFDLGRSHFLKVVGTDLGLEDGLANLNLDQFVDLLSDFEKDSQLTRGFIERAMHRLQAEVLAAELMGIVPEATVENFKPHLSPRELAAEGAWNRFDQKWKGS